MRLIIEARLEAGETSETKATTVAVVERKDRSVADLGLTLAEGRALLAEIQSLLVSEQAAGWMESQLACHRCGSILAHKDARSIVLRTVFGKVDVPSPRLWACSCAVKQGQPRRSVSPLCKAVHQRVTPELEYLQAKWAAHLPYRQATELLREVFPLDKGISFGSTRRRILAVGSALDAQIERDIASGPKAVSAEQVRESTTVGRRSVDSAWLASAAAPRAARRRAILGS
jgi:hypothetical protein